MVVEFAWAVAIASASTDTTTPAMPNESAVGTSRPKTERRDGHGEHPDVYLPQPEQSRQWTSGAFEWYRYVTAAQLEDDNATGPFYGRVAYTHGGGIDPPLEIVRMGFPLAVSAAEAGERLEGGTVGSARIRKPTNPNHGTVHVPCSTCQRVIDAIGAIFEH